VRIDGRQIAEYKAKKNSLWEDLERAFIEKGEMVDEEITKLAKHYQQMRWWWLMEQLREINILDKLTRLREQGAPMEMSGRRRVTLDAAPRR
jgi:L-rhamnose mutarotase